jgi:hypothetical protein
MSPDTQSDIKQKIEAANAEAVKRIHEAAPVLVDVAPAGEVIPGLKDRMILHSGPPVDWEKMCGAQRGAVIGVALFEGWAKSAEEAEKLLQSGGWRTGLSQTGRSAGRSKDGSSLGSTAKEPWRGCGSGAMSGLPPCGKASRKEGAWS